MGSETFHFTLTFSNNNYELKQPTNNNLVYSISKDKAEFQTHPSIANYYYFGTEATALLLDYTLCDNLTTASRLAQIEAGQGLPTAVSVSVTNFPAVQTVSVNNFPATQPVSGTVTVNQGTSPWVTSTSTAVPASADLVGASRTTTGTLVTIPAGRTFNGAVSLSCSVSVAGNSQPSISVSGAGALPSGTIHQIIAVGLALTVVANSNTQSNVWIYGGTGGATVTFTQGATGTSTGQITGRLL